MEDNTKKKRLILVGIETASEFLAAKKVAEDFHNKDAFNYRDEEDRTSLLGVVCEGSRKTVRFLVGAEGPHLIVYKENKS